mmetsp:Transcript_13780/g.35402  ORF Transcript_13780/g.35402 Transcript_13780/m.35402 type:complete len:601 (+) Transcript_13780:152-1954(+)
MPASIKVFYTRPGVPDDVRRFKLDEPLQFDALQAKLAAIYGVAYTNLTWKDEDGDAVTIGNAEDLDEAARSCSGTLKVYAAEGAAPVDAPVEAGAVEGGMPEVPADDVPSDGSDGWYQVDEAAAAPGPEPETTAEVTEVSAPIDDAVVDADTVGTAAAAPAPAVAQPTQVPAVHLRVACDVTGMFPIVGNRWHRIGDNFDLCDKAFQELAEAEKVHFELITSPNSKPVPFMMAEAAAAPAPETETETEHAPEAPVVHPGVKCDVSGMAPIVGNRWHLIGHNYDVCQAEFDKLSKEKQQRFELIATPGDRARPFGYPLRFTKDGDAAEQAAQLLRTVLTALQDNYSVEIDLVPRGSEGAHQCGPVQAEVPINVETVNGELRVDAQVDAEVFRAAEAGSPANAAEPATEPEHRGRHGHRSRGPHHGQRGHGHKWHKHGRRRHATHAVLAGEVLPEQLFGQGACGAGVQQMQNMLVDIGYLNPDALRPRHPGFFGPRTRSAIEGFQKDRQLVVTGAFDVATRVELLRVKTELEAPAVPVTAEPIQPRVAPVQADPVQPEPEPVKWQDEIRMLRSMGFDNVELLMPILDRTNGHVDAVIAALLD